MHSGRAYLIGGRRLQPVNIFDPVQKTWTERDGPGVLLHHMQCVGWNGRIYVASAWGGTFPRETTHANIWIYDPQKDSWSTRAGLPEDRRRGGAAAVLWDDKIWVVGGNRGGHGLHATTLGWMDYYDLVRQRWTVGLPDLPEGRDHVGGAIVQMRDGNALCIAGGRDGGQKNFFGATVDSTYCYNFTSRSWRNMEADVPFGRGGGATGAIFFF